MTANAIVWTYLENKPQTTMGRILCMFVIYFVLIVDHCKLVSGITSLMVGKRQICRARIPLGGYCGQMTHRCCGMTVCKMYDSKQGRLDRCPIWASVYECVCVLPNDTDGRSLMTVRDNREYLPIIGKGVLRHGGQKTEQERIPQPCAGKVPQEKPCSSHSVCCGHMLCSTYNLTPCPRNSNRRCICLPRRAIYGR